MPDNPVLDIAVDFVNHTGRHVFLTGRAGTGKTTFLRYIRENTPKKCVVVAPTGVAAINAAGVTMHSLFQLPLGPFIPGAAQFSGAGTDKSELFRNLRMNEEKRDLLRDLELVIIDEVSMVRCDTLDAMDAILRYVRRRFNEPFGGVQILYIGDLFQLPPVMPEYDWNLLQRYYESPFFFHAKVVQSSPPVYLELKKVYRQKEMKFVSLLNNVRNGDVSVHDLEILNERYNAPLKQGVNYVTLTTHNLKADRINQDALARLPGDICEFRGTVEGDFPDKTLPTDITLQLKEGAQVMFIRNDKSGSHRYYNGKLATVRTISGENITVELAGDGEEIVVEKETWNNIKYSYDPAAERIDEEKLGSFTQYPIRLAWAITIHKSQGLTFDNALIDAEDSFAPGQVYVALSRCTSLSGLVLRSRISERSISTDPRVQVFARNEIAPIELDQILGNEKRVYLNRSLLERFDLSRTTDLAEQLTEALPGMKVPDMGAAREMAANVLKAMREATRVSVKFQEQLKSLLNEGSDDAVRDRASKAVGYFSDLLTRVVLNPLDEHIEGLSGKTRVKKYLRLLRSLRKSVAKKITAIRQARYGDVPLVNDAEPVPALSEPMSKGRSPKGQTLKESLALFRSGMNAAEISRKRNLALSTIEGHLAMLVSSGDISISEFVASEKLDEILGVLREHPSSNLKEVKNAVGDRASFGEIRAVLNHLSLANSTET